jgi:4-carboxymuconolactone decarboxylase
LLSLRGVGGRACLRGPSDGSSSDAPIAHLEKSRLARREPAFLISIDRSADALPLGRRPASLPSVPQRDSRLSLASLCAAAATGRLDAVEGATRAALDAGCAPDEIREALLTLAPFCGFPRTLDAMALACPLLGSAPAGRSLPASAARGAAFFDVVYGQDAARVRAKLVAIDPEVARWIEEDAYGTVLSRPGIDPALREKIGVVLLVAQGLRNQVSGHVKGALNFGASAAEIAVFLDAASPFLAAEELAFARETLARVGGDDR